MKRCWEDIGNKGEKYKIPLPSPHQKEKDRAHHECKLSLLIGSLKVLFPKLFVTIFGLG